MTDATNTIKVEPKFINNNQFPIVVTDGAGGRYEIAPGEVVQGNKYRMLLDPRKGLIEYFGERVPGKMARFYPKSQVPENRTATSMKNINIQPQDLPNYVKPIANQEENIVVDASAGTGRYLNKSLEDWKTEAKQNKLVELTRGQLAGLGRFLGIDIASGSKQEILPVMMARLVDTPKEKVEPSTTKK